MASITPNDTLASAPAAPRSLGATILVLLLAVPALLFVWLFVMPYAFEYGPERLAQYWPRRFGLLFHVGLGAVALLIGLFQIWPPSRTRYRVIHRWAGRAFMVAVLVSGLASIRLAGSSGLGPVYTLSLVGLCIAWIGSAAIGFLAIRNRQIELHRRWMTRCYVVTFAFVIYRILVGTLPAFGVNDLAQVHTLAAWLSWTVPLILTLIVEGMLDIRRKARV